MHQWAYGFLLLLVGSGIGQELTKSIHSSNPVSESGHEAPRHHVFIDDPKFADLASGDHVGTWGDRLAQRWQASTDARAALKLLRPQVPSCPAGSNRTELHMLGVPVTLCVVPTDSGSCNAYTVGTAPHRHWERTLLDAMPCQVAPALVGVGAAQLPQARPPGDSRRATRILTHMHR